MKKLGTVEGNKRHGYDDLTGRKFNFLTAIKVDHIKTWPSGQSTRKWLCQCDCGETTTVGSGDLKTGSVRSCGCIQRKAASESIRAYMMSKGIKKSRHDDSPIYGVWAGMKRRCFSENCGCFEYYGGRGITICERWMDFDNFHADMIGTYASGLTIDRIDVNGGYSPGNCKWATRHEQSKNRRSSKMLELDGLIMTQADWGRYLGGSKNTIAHRLKAGWSIREALTTRARVMTKSGRYCTK